MAGKLIGNGHLRALTNPRSSSLCFSLPTSSLMCSSRRLHESAYEKEVQVPAIGDISADKPEEEYWEPDPETGVFVPASEQNSEETVVTCTTEETVLDEKAFFRPLEDLELPPPETFTGEIPPVDPFAD